MSPDDHDWQVRPSAPPVSSVAPRETLAQLHSHRAGKPSHLSAKVCAMTGSLLIASEVAELLGVPKSWVYEQSRSGRILTVTLGRYRRYRREAIEAWLEDLEEESGGRWKRRAA